MPPAPVAQFYEALAKTLADRDPWEVIDQDPGIRSLQWPDEFEAIPSSVVEACGFYWLNRVHSDNGTLYLFIANANGAPTYGVLGTSDGSDKWLEVYALDGALLGAARFDTSVVLWRDRQDVRRKVWEGRLEPELLQAREARGRQ